MSLSLSKNRSLTLQVPFSLLYLWRPSWAVCWNDLVTPMWKHYETNPCSSPLVHQVYLEKDEKWTACCRSGVFNSSLNRTLKTSRTNISQRMQRAAMNLPWNVHRWLSNVILLLWFCKWVCICLQKQWHFHYHTGMCVFGCYCVCACVRVCGIDRWQ